MNNYKIVSVDSDAATGAIHAVWLEITRQVESQQQTAVLGVSLDYNTSGPEFLPYSSVTESVALKWAKDKIKESEIEAQFKRLYPAKPTSVVPW
jgi:hypothetical protein